MQHKKNIYIVDDVYENIQVLGHTLNSNGYNISVARNGEQALTGIKTKKPDLVLLDVSMPGIDGYEVCEKLKEDEETAEIPVIFITARTQTDDIVKGFKAGGVDYITKPFNTEELLLRVKTQLDLVDSKKQLIELNATKDMFFRIISHDLRGPISILLSFTGLMVNHIDRLSTEEMKDYLSQLNKKTAVASKLLENLLLWARSQSGEIEHNPEEIPLAELINEQAELFNSDLQNKQIEFTSQIEENCLIYADKNMINTVLRNLCSNAIKFTPEKGKISVKCQPSNNHFEISVIDNGVGIKPEHIDKIFRIDKYYSTKGTANEKGSGLGLILCKEFVEKNGGKIWVDSNVQTGSSFTFTVSKPISNS